ncbi:30S ribosomal protein S20 [bacterium]|nr:MAG: 30S ribosomal protein S20 [bacterium]
MANLKSSKKDLRRIAKRRVRNQATKSALKTFVKKVRVAASATTPDTETVQKALLTATSALDKAAQRGIIHKNQAARRKSRVAKAANKAAASTAA